MKHFHIAIMVMACIFATWACTPKAAIPSAARLAEKEYERAIRTERKAREKLKTETLAKQNGYYIPNDQQNMTSKERREYNKQLKIQEELVVARMVDSLVDAQRFKIQLTGGFVSLAMNNLNSRVSGDKYSKLLIDSTEIDSYLTVGFVFKSYKYDYKIKSRTKDVINIEINVPEPKGYKLLLTIKSDGKAEIYATCTFDYRPAVGKTTTGSFYGYILPIEQDFNP